MNRRIRDGFYFISRKNRDLLEVIDKTVFDCKSLIQYVFDFITSSAIFHLRFTAADTTRIKPGSIRNVDRGKYKLSDLI